MTNWNSNGSSDPTNKMPAWPHSNKTQALCRQQLIERQSDVTAQYEELSRRQSSLEQGHQERQAALEQAVTANCSKPVKNWKQRNSRPASKRLGPQNAQRPKST